MNKIAELYVLANIDEVTGDIVGYPTGGGSSTASRVKAYESLSSARRVASQYGCSIIKITDAEVIE